MNTPRLRSWIKRFQISFQVWSERQGGAFSREDQALELHVQPQVQTDFGKRLGCHHASQLPPGLVGALLQHCGARAAGAVWRPALPLRMCGGD